MSDIAASVRRYSSLPGSYDTKISKSSPTRA